MRYILTLLISSLISLTYAQSNAAYGKLDTNQILIGDQVNFTLTCIQKKNSKVDFPKFVDTIIKGVEIVESFPQDTIKDEDDQLTIEKRYTITVFDSGAYMLPVGPFIENKDTIRGKSLFLSVNTIQADTTANSIKPIKLPYNQGYTFKELLPWILGGLALIGIIAGIIIYLRIKQKNADTEIKKYVPKDPPHIIAYRSLDELKAEQLWEKEEYKAYYTKLTEILRIYLEQKYQILALEQTSEEILSDVKDLNLLNFEIIQDLSQILMLADMVKFAKHIPQAEENVRSYDLALKFIDKSKFIDKPVAPIQENSFASTTIENPKTNEQ